ncbi:MAG: shikimate dehydrogenase [Deltaproteobacteria bacterium]|nr:shikimate dehydrogenase [Deltaproteobacteria bacterium]
MKISGKVKVVGIFGDPVEQTLSPYMHNAAFEALGLELVYVPFHVRQGMLKNAVDGVRALDILGVNVTIPFKERVMEYLDSVDDEALSIGAVNTIVNAGGKLRGYNTDGRGYWTTLIGETGFDPRGKTIIVLGAGGSGRAIIFSVLGKGPKTVIIANRTVKKAESLAKEFGRRSPGVDIKAMGLDIAEPMRGADLLINTTPVGMTGIGARHPFLPLKNLPPSAIVSDIVYKPLDTPLMKDAREKGLRVHGGLGMLVWQGALSFSLWTGADAPVEVMRLAAAQALEVS